MTTPHVHAFTVTATLRGATLSVTYPEVQVIPHVDGNAPPPIPTGLSIAPFTGAAITAICDGVGGCGLQINCDNLYSTDSINASIVGTTPIVVVPGTGP